MADRQIYRTQNPYEKKFGYARAVRKGPFIFISGTTAIPPDHTDAEIKLSPSAKDQALAAFRNALHAIFGVKGDAKDIVRIRMFVRRTQDCGLVGEAMKEFLGDWGIEGMVAATMISGVEFVNPDMLVEIEVDAVTDS